MSLPRQLLLGIAVLLLAIFLVGEHVENRRLGLRVNQLQERVQQLERRAVQVPAWLQR